MNNSHAIINTLRAIDSYEDLLVAIDTLESVVYNFENPECSCDYLRDACPDEVRAYEKACGSIRDALLMMME